jgi:protein arginine kinase
MRLADLTTRAGEWLRGIGPMRDVVISSRVRLARNLVGMPFLSRCTSNQQKEIAQQLRDRALEAQLTPDVFYVDVAAASDLDRQLLVERHLISRHLADGKAPRGVIISADETLAVMMNEEDHLRIQVLRSGLQLLEAMQEINRVDDRLEACLDYAYHSRYGYLTACPTNVGSGLRVSVMLHLPGLKFVGEIEKAFRAARAMRLEVRGLYGEGTDGIGDFFQVSNQVTLGRSEQEIAEDFCHHVIPQIIEYEQRARAAMLRQDAILDDKVLRSLALLRSARLIGSEETMYLLSLLRLGVGLGRVSGISMDTVNDLFLLTQPAHLQRILGREMDGRDRAEARAKFIRGRLGAG